MSLTRTLIFKCLLLIDAFAAALVLPARVALAAQPYCAFVDEHGKPVRLDKSVTGPLQADFEKLRQPPSPDFLKAVRANPAFRLDTYRAYNNGKTFLSGSGFVCDTSTDTVGHFLGCLQAQSDAISAAKTKAAITELKGLFEDSINPALSAAKQPDYAQTPEQWQEFFDDTQAGFYNGDSKAADKVKAYAATMKNILGACAANSCADAAKKASIDFNLAVAGTTTPAALTILGQKLRHQQGVGGGIYFKACADAGHDDFESHEAEKARIESEKLAFMFTDGAGNTCDSAIPRVVCNSGGAVDPGDTLPKATLPAFDLLKTNIHDDMAQFVKDSYLSGWNKLALSNLSGDELAQAQSRVQKAMSCPAGNTDADKIAKGLGLGERPATPAVKANPAAQKEAKLEGAIAAACIQRLVPEFELLQLKHGKGLTIASSVSDEVNSYIAEAKKGMTPEERRRFELMSNTADFAQVGLYAIPGLGQMIPMLKIAGSAVVKTPLLGLADAYADKNKCAGIYTPSDPIYRECAASFALMTQVGAEASEYLRMYPTLALPDDRYTTGYLGYQRANTYIPPDVRSIVDHYVPKAGAPTCQEQVRTELMKKGEESKVEYNDEVFSASQTQKLLKDIENQLAKFCSPAGRRLEADAMALSPAMLGRYFSCDRAAADPQWRDSEFSCDARKHYAWVICQKNIELNKLRKDGNGDAEAVGQIIATLMDATAGASPAGALGLGSLAGMGHAAAFGGVMGAGSAGAMLLAQGDAPTSSALQSALDHERAQFAGGLGGTTDSVEKARLALEDYKKQNEGLLSNHPVWKAAIEGAMSGLLMGGMSAGPVAEPALRSAGADAAAAVHQGASDAWTVARLAAEQKASAEKRSIADVYTRLFGGTATPDQALAPLEGKLRPEVEKIVEEANPDLKPSEVHRASPNRLAQMARDAVDDAADRAISAADREAANQELAGFVNEPGVKPEVLVKRRALADGDPVTLVKINKRLIEQYGNKVEDVRKFEDALAEDQFKGICRSADGIRALAKQCGLVLNTKIGN